MIRAPRVPRPSRPVLLTILVTGLLALPMGVVLASHQFSDVPNSNAFHADVDALVDAGVTAGCASGKYCPKANVTREQMAAFLNRLGALAPGKTPVVNADRVDGLDSSAFARPLFAVVNANGSLARGSGATSSSQPEGTGTYEVIFNRNISQCAFNATLGLAGDTGSSPPGFVTVVGRFTTPNGVYITTADTAGTATNLGFHLAVTCPGSTGAVAVDEVAPTTQGAGSGNNQP